MSDEPAEMPKGFAQSGYEAPAGATQILLVRHGASQAYVPGKLFDLTEDGQGDPPLAAEGEAQAELVGERLAREKIDAIYVTNLIRTAQTAAPLVAATGIRPRIEPGLREAFLGEWEGGLFREKIVEPGNPYVAKFLETGRWDSIPGGESNEALEQRCLDSLWRMADAHPGGNVVSFVHGGVIRAIISHAAGVGPTNGQFGGAANCSIHHLVLWAGTIAVRSFNDTSHLSPAFSPYQAANLSRPLD